MSQQLWEALAPMYARSGHAFPLAPVLDVLCHVSQGTANGWLLCRQPSSPSLVVSEHYADDLEVDLADAMLQDFNVELQDDSPRQVLHWAVALAALSLINAGSTLLTLTVGVHHACWLPPGMLTRQLQHTTKPASQRGEPAESSKVTTGSGAYCTSGFWLGTSGIMPSSIVGDPWCSLHCQ